MEELPLSRLVITASPNGYIIDAVNDKERAEWAHTATFPWLICPGDSQDDTDTLISLLYDISSLFNPNIKLKIIRDII